MRKKDRSGHRISTWASPFSHCLHAGNGGQQPLLKHYYYYYYYYYCLVSFSAPRNDFFTSKVSIFLLYIKKPFWAFSWNDWHFFFFFFEFCTVFLGGIVSYLGCFGGTFFFFFYLCVSMDLNLHLKGSFLMGFWCAIIHAFSLAVCIKLSLTM